MKLVLFVVLFGLLFGVSIAIQCKSHVDSEVSWFVAYKMPKMAGAAVGSADGVGFYYLDAIDKAAFKPSPVAISSPNQAIGYTLNQFFKNQGDKALLHVFYNDEPAVASPLMHAAANLTGGKPVFENGHTKGVVLFDEKSGTGVWIIHSVPKFPPPAGQQYAYPDSGHIYGQTFICMTLPTAILKTIGTTLFYTRADIYSVNMPQWAKTLSPDLVKAANGEYSTDVSPLQYSLKTVGANSADLTGIFKTGTFGKDLWSMAVAPSLKASLVVESWRRGDPVEKNCKEKYPVVDAMYIQLSGTSDFKYTKDHSKYARSIDRKDAVVCIGDINRMTSQYVRGGGTVCMRDPQLWNAFALFKEADYCPLPPSHPRSLFLSSNRVDAV